MRNERPSLALSTATLVLANLVPLGGALLGFWATYDLILLFWAENVVIGLLQLLRLVVLAARRRDWSAAALAPFFAFHYGLFTFGHGAAVVNLLAPPGEARLADAVMLLLSPAGLLWALLPLAASHAISFVVNFLRGGEWRDAEPRTLVGQPYSRVVVLHLAVLLGGAVVMALGEPIAALVLLVALKIAMDVRAHRREHAAALNAG
ncbi:DUF6498-containing protein [Falsiroseomonas sp.]|uniref:DUF6498-containing protein n=1 Tax=Falsiroseomonas sp. TaxID=2870721 RepID=UPI00356AE020